MLSARVCDTRARPHEFLSGSRRRGQVDDDDPTGAEIHSDDRSRGTSKDHVEFGIELGPARCMVAVGASADGHVDRIFQRSLMRHVPQGNTPGFGVVTSRRRHSSVVVAAARPTERSSRSRVMPGRTNTIRVLAMGDRERLRPDQGQRRPSLDGPDRLRLSDLWVR